MAIEFIFNNKTAFPPYSLPYEDNIIRSNTENGCVHTRKRYTKTRKEFTIKWQGNDDDYEAAEDFYSSALAGGVNSFNLIVLNVFNKVLFSGSVKLTKPYVPTYNGLGTWEFEYSFREA